MNQKRDEDNTQNFVPVTVDTEVGHYKIVKKIGAGGMGEVFLAKDKELEREVALKFLPAHLVTDNDVRTRFIREAKAAAKLNHPNIVTIHEVSEFNGRPYFAMEHVKGQTLQHFAQEKPLPLEKVINLISQICEGLAEAHAEEIVHRDIKSTNIVVGEKGRPRILDFGLATVKGEEKLTRTGSTVGTVAYMSPEQIAGRETDARSDIFSLGVVFYELVTGRTPFRRDNNSATMSAITNDEPEPMARYKSGVTDDLERIVAKALRKDASSRYQTVKDMLADLRNYSKSGKSTERTNGRKMVVVLPFENLGSVDDEYFADGITEEIISRLAVVSGLGVISRTSALRYKGTKKTIAEIGSELGVDYILEGTVRWARASGGASRVRITPQLIHVTDDTHLWAERYDREIDDIFEVQSDIAEKVIEQLNVTLLQSEKEAIQEKPTDNVNAYDLFLKGKERFNSPNYAKEDFEAALGYFEKAIKIEPDFALAHVYISRCHSSMYFFGHDVNEQRATNVKKSLDRAFAIDKDLPEAHLALGEWYYRYDRQLDRALEQVDVAAEKLPHDSDFLRCAILRRKGLCSDSVQIANKLMESNPGDLAMTVELAVTNSMMQRYDRAIEYFDQATAMSPETYTVYIHRIMMELARGRPKTARQIVENLPAEVDRTNVITSIQAYHFSRDYEGGIKRVAEFAKKVKVFEDQVEYLPIDTLYGLFYKSAGDVEKSKSHLENARELLMSKNAESSEDSRIQMGLAFTLALLGDYEKAIEHGKIAMKIMPVYKDAFIGPTNEYFLAAVLTYASRYDDAIDVIERMLGRRLFHTLPFFTENPIFDPIENHPRMLALKEEYAYQYENAE